MSNGKDELLSGQACCALLFVAQDARGSGDGAVSRPVEAAGR